MSKYVVDKKTLTDIADAIRRRNVSETGIKAENFAAEIEGIGKAEFKSLIERSITEIDIPEGATKIAGYCFFNATALKKVTVPSSVTRIESCAFQSCTALEEIKIPTSISSMSYEVFRSCKNLKNVTFEEGSLLTQVPNYAFYGCESLPEITLPSSINHIGSYAFANCQSCLKYDLSELTVIPSTYDKPFDGINENAKIIVPESLFLSWITATNWATYKDYITTPKNGFELSLNMSRYIVNEGMTWGEWVASDYSKGEFKVDEDEGVRPFAMDCIQVTLFVPREDGGYDYHYVKSGETVLKDALYNII